MKLEDLPSRIAEIRHGTNGTLYKPSSSAGLHVMGSVCAQHRACVILLTTATKKATLPIKSLPGPARAVLFPCPPMYYFAHMPVTPLWFIIHLPTIWTKLTVANWLTSTVLGWGRKAEHPMEIHAVSGRMGKLHKESTWRIGSSEAKVQHRHYGQKGLFPWSTFLCSMF